MKRNHVITTITVDLVIAMLTCSDTSEDELWRIMRVCADLILEERALAETHNE